MPVSPLPCPLDVLLDLREKKIGHDADMGHRASASWPEKGSLPGLFNKVPV